MQDTDAVLDIAAIPSWYREIYPAGDYDGFYHKIGDHAVAFVERSAHQLVVSFDNLAEAGHPGYDKEAWAANFCAYNGWSHLGVFTQSPSWFRDARLIAFLERLKRDGLFARFSHVTFCGTSMGGFGALAFAGLAPGCNVIAFSPQTTLRESLVPWEDRFKKGRDRDWSLKFSDAARTLRSSARVYLVYDPFHVNDTAHVTRLKGKNLIHLRAPGLGHRTALFLNKLDALKPVMGEAILGTLTPASFHTLIRGRGGRYLYKQNMARYLEERGRQDRYDRLDEAYKARQRRLAE